MFRIVGGQPQREQGAIGASDHGAAPDRSYEPPRIVVLGTVADLTRGTDTGGTDGLGPGSVIH
jgi:hypothetical protein